MTTTVALSEKDGPEDSATMTEALAGYEEYKSRPRDWRQQHRWRGIDDGSEESTTITEASAEEDEHKDYKNNNRGVGGGRTTCPRDRRQLRRRQRINNRPGLLATTMEC